MVDSVGPVQPHLPPMGPEEPGSVKPDKAAAGKGSFKEVLNKSIQEVNELQQEADHAIQDLAAGKKENYSDVINAVEKADVAFKTLMQVRNKLVNAYQELNRMRL